MQREIRIDMQKVRSNLHDFVVTNNFDCHLKITTSAISGANNVRKDTMACVAVNSVALIQHLADTHTYVQDKNVDDNCIQQD